MKVFRYIAVAFSLYSRIPMPIFNWKDDDMKNSLIFFPWVGIIIGAISFVSWRISINLRLPGIVIMLILSAIPILVTGGFHLDGYMDVEDARRSYADKDKKLEILKDPHIGAFAVIGLIKILLIFAGALGILVYRGDDDSLILYCLSFVLARAVSGILARLMPKAKKDGMLYEETKSSGHYIEILLMVQGGTAAIFMLLVDYKLALLILAALLINIVLYRHMTKREFGGVTGDTAGYFLVTSETMMLLFLAIGIML